MTAKVSGPDPKSKFVFGDPSADSNKPNTVNDLVKLDAYLVSYNDGASKKLTRLVFKIPGSDTVLILNEKVGGSRVMVAGAEWFNKAVSGKVESKAEAAAPSPSSMAAQV